MKKILLFVSALAGLFLAGSCQREELAPVEEAGVVTFEVNVPGVATKGIGDVPSVDNLVYEVYWTDAETVDATISPDALTLLYKGTKDVVKGKSTVPVELLKDKNYVILFWAQRGNTWGFASEDRLLKNGVTFPDEFRANAEDIEAFYGVSFLTKTKLTGSKNVTLYRPFAQLNVGTKLPNDKENPNYTVSLKESKVVVKNAGAKFNLIKQEAEGNKEQITFTSATVPSGVLEANDDSYHYAAMNYIFAAGNVSVQIDITTNDHGTIILEEIPAVPVAKNYRTNIIGSLLTSDVKYNVTLDKDWGDDGKNMDVVIEGLVKNINGDYEITTVEGFAYAINELFADGGTFYIHPGTYNFTGIKVEPKETNQGAILNVKANVVPVVTRSTTPEFEIIGLNVPLVAKVSENSQALFSNIVLPGETKLVGENNGVVGVSGCSNEDTADPAELIDVNGQNGKVVNTSSITSVAQINAAIEAGLTLIELTDDITADAKFTISSSLTIDGNGKTWTYRGSDRAFDVPADATKANVTIKNLNLVAAGYCARGINYNTNGKLIIDNVVVSCSDPTTAITYAINMPGSSDNATVSIKNSDLTGNIALNVWGEKCVINVVDTKLNTYDASTAEGYSTVKLNNDGTTSAEGSVINITGGSINIFYKNADDNDSSPVNNATATGQINISESTEVDGEIDNTKNSAAVMYKGSYDFYAFVELQDAINKAAENSASVECVRILRDVEVDETIVIPADLTLTIDLNGKTLSHKDVETAYAINNHGNLTITGNGTVNSRGIYNGYDANGNYVATATLTIENGTFNAKGTNGGAAVYNYGKVTINGGEFESVGGYGLNNQSGSVMTLKNANVRGGIYVNGATLNVENSNIYQHISGRHAIYNLSGNITVESGSFDSESGNELILADGPNASVVLNGGTYNKTAKSWLLGAATNKNISFVINGGTYNGYVNLPENTVDTIRPYGDPIVVKGGSFNFNPTQWLAEGYISLKLGDKNYTVVQTNGTLTMNDGSTLNLGEVEFDGTIEALGDLTIIGDTKIKTLKATNGGTITIEDGKTLTLNNFSFGAKATADAVYEIKGGTVVANYGFFQHGKYSLNSNFETGYMYYSYGSDITVYGTFHSQGKGDGLDYVRGKLTIAEGGRSIHDKSLWVGQPASWGAMNASLVIEEGGYVQANSLSVYEGSSLTYSNDDDLKYNSVTGTEYITKK